MQKCHKNTCPNPRTCKCRTVREAVIPIVWLIGGTGAGKMTLGKSLAEHFDMDYVSTGEVLRQVVNDHKDKNAKTIDKTMNEGQLVNDEIVVEILDRHLRKLLKKSKGFIVSFAKNLNQAALFEKFISPVDLMLYLEASDETLKARSKARAADGGGNEDDLEELIDERIKVFHSYIEDVKKEYKDHLRVISAERSAEEIMSEVVPLIEAVTAKKLAEKPQPTCGPEDACPPETAAAAADEAAAAAAPSKSDEK